VVKRFLKRAWHVLRHVPDRALHPLRRERAARQLRGRAPASVMFVCHGNICRSPFAALLFDQLANDRLPSRIDTSSVGFIGPGRGSPPPALAAAARRGIDLSAHRSRLVTPKLIRSTGLVVVMSAEQARTVKRYGDGVRVLVLGDLDPAPIMARTVIDPWGGSDEVFDDSYDRIDRCVRELVRLIAGNAGEPATAELGRPTRASSAASAGRE
jgi:protein-tyrosine phosphatase